MSGSLWTAIAWVLVVAVAAAAHIFGREARPSGPSADPAAVHRSRVGVALSITGPLVVLIAGLIVAIATESWLTTALATVVAILLVTAAGLYLAPD